MLRGGRCRILPPHRPRVAYSSRSRRTTGMPDALSVCAEKRTPAMSGESGIWWKTLADPVHRFAGSRPRVGCRFLNRVTPDLSGAKYARDCTESLSGSVCNRGSSLLLCGRGPSPEPIPLQALAFAGAHVVTQGVDAERAALLVPGIGKPFCRKRADPVGGGAAAALAGLCLPARHLAPVRHCPGPSEPRRRPRRGVRCGGR